MDPAQVMIWNIEELREIVDNPSARGASRASAILRAILLDKNPLLHEVSKRIGKKLLFGLSASPEEQRKNLDRGHDDPKATMFLYENLAAMEPRFHATLDQFLSFPLQVAGGEVMSVKDAIKYVANNDGGVHYDSHLQEEKLRTLREANSMFGLGGMPMGYRSMIDLAEITLKAIDPIYRAIKA